MTAKKNDLAASLFFLIFSGGLYYSAGTFPTRDTGSRVLNPGFYPQFLAIILGILSLLLLISVLRNPDRKEEPQKFWKSAGSLLLFGVTLLLLILFPLLMELLGFAVTSFLFILILVFALAGQGQKRPLVLFSVSTGITVVIVLVFKVILEIPFPRGMLF